MRRDDGTLLAPTLANYPSHFGDCEPYGTESSVEYARRLVELGFDECGIAKALALHFDWRVERWGEFFERFPEARLRYIHLLDAIHPNRSRYSLTMKIAKSCGLDHERAAVWLERYERWMEARNGEAQP